jgi:predicted O-linked N-acetylglucosamine transferase (SPINDLY family)
VVAKNILPLFRNHDREAFEIFCYSGVGRPDVFTREFQRLAGQWRNTAGVTDDALAEMIRQDGIDILVDLAQHTAGNRLPVFARQPAPVQVSFAGYPASTGLSQIEYRISDRYLEAGASEMGDGRSQIDRRAERVFFIDSFWCYDPSGMQVAVNALPAVGRGQVTFGSLCSFSKINPPVLKLWARVLGAVKDSRLVLLSGLGSHRAQTAEVLEREGIARKRVEFFERRPRQAYLESYHSLDVMLDPFPYGGHTTSLDALWTGVPVVSLAGSTPVSRAGLSILSNLGLPELVASSAKDYVRIAAELAGDLPRLAELRRTLRSRMEASVLMDGALFARQLEAAFRAAWVEWCAESSGNR